ncbi:MOSC domain-containing protein [Phenylobacterium deserti]|uniref:MOSC domain-containing protein n=1 Tax=Phenylobacterium deserti TaxID=1914756 RepID=A0A328AQ30_9CAUL|nr:MOSC domain-containing protein [Phenylobacterium deserti]RAK56679.1 MOSC domain-containing protein [Phenylobacterium deserti]
MLNPSSALARLLDGPMQPGAVAWLGSRPVRRAPMTVLESVELAPGEGVLGDHYKSRTNGPRQVTLIAAEDLAAIASFLGRAEVESELLRRNIVTRGVNLRALKGRRVRVGGAILETTGECHPCSRMEELLGPGGYNAVRGHGGFTARVLEGGWVRLGDAVERLDG